jgi:hypothetical protein
MDRDGWRPRKRSIEEVCREANSAIQVNDAARVFRGMSFRRAKTVPEKGSFVDVSHARRDSRTTNRGRRPVGTEVVGATGASPRSFRSQQLDDFLVLEVSGCFEGSAAVFVDSCLVSPVLQEPCHGRDVVSPGGVM